MGLAALAATFYSIAGCYIGGERYDEKVRICERNTCISLAADKYLCRVADGLEKHRDKWRNSHSLYDKNFIRIIWNCTRNGICA